MIADLGSYSQIRFHSVIKRLTQLGIAWKVSSHDDLLRSNDDNRTTWVMFTNVSGYYNFGLSLTARIVYDLTEDEVVNVCLLLAGSDR